MQAMFQRPPEEVAPDAGSYSHVMQTLLTQQKVAEVFELRREMEAQGVKADLVIYNQLIAACGPGMDLEFAFSLMDELQAAGFTPDMYTYHNLLKVRVCGFVGVCVSVRIRGSHSSMRARRVLLWQVLCAAGDFETVAAVLEAMEEQGVRANGTTMEIITSAARSHGRDDVVEALAEHPMASAD